MIRAGDSTVHFSKVKPMQLAEIRSVLQKRPAEKFSMGLSPEAQEAMQQVLEDSKIEQNAKKGKRGSKGNVLFKETVEIRQEIIPPHNSNRRASCSDIFEVSSLDNIYTNHIGALLEGSDGDFDGMSSPRYHGRRHSSVSKLLRRRGSLGTSASTVDEVDEVESANRVNHDMEEEEPTEDNRGVTEDLEK